MDPDLAAAQSQQTQTEPAPSAESQPTFKPEDVVYYTQLPKELQTPETGAKLAKAGKTLGHLAGEYLKALENQEKLSGKVVLPDDNAKPEDWEPVWSRLGVPKDKSGYDKFDRAGEFKDLPALDGLDDELAELAAKHKIPKKAYEGFRADQSRLTLRILAKSKADFEAAQAAALEKKKSEGLAAAKAFQDLAGTSRDEAVVELRQIVKDRQVMSESDWKAIEDGPLGNSPTFLMFLRGMRKAMSETPVASAAGPGSAAPNTVRGAIKEALRK